MHFNKGVGGLALLALFNVLTGIDSARVASQDKQVSDLFQAKAALAVGKGIGGALGDNLAGNVTTMMTADILAGASFIAGFVGNAAGLMAAEISEEAATVNQPYTP